MKAAMSSFCVLLCSAVLLASAGCETTHGQSASSFMDDTSITTSVKARLASDQMGTVTRIDVETTRGIVHLNGVVDSVEDKERVERIAGGVEGVKRIVNNLQVRK
ncbi:MAG TPA: BON domain-containing protein [Nitrospiraceae bacterium]|nr:BON domain-containing protein [Nitrospiraceae bacterium]